VLKKSPIFRDFYPEPTFTLEKITTFCIFKKSRLLPKSLRTQGTRGHKGLFFFFLVICVFLLVEKEGEGFVVFLNYCGGNLTTIIITIKDF
jgi:hypothetical protein